LLLRQFHSHRFTHDFGRPLTGKFKSLMTVRLHDEPGELYVTRQRRSSQPNPSKTDHERSKKSTPTLSNPAFENLCNRAVPPGSVIPRQPRSLGKMKSPVALAQPGWQADHPPSGIYNRNNCSRRRIRGRITVSCADSDSDAGRREDDVRRMQTGLVRSLRRDNVVKMMTFPSAHFSLCSF